MTRNDREHRKYVLEKKGWSFLKNFKKKNGVAMHCGFIGRHPIFGECFYTDLDKLIEYCEEQPKEIEDGYK